MRFRSVRALPDLAKNQKKALKKGFLPVWINKGGETGQIYFSYSTPFLQKSLKTAL